MKLLLQILVCQTLGLLSPIAIAQQKDSVKNSSFKDTTNNSFVAKMHAFAKESAISSAKELDADKAALVQNKILEEVKKNIQKAKIYLKKIEDTSITQLKLKLIEADRATAIDGVITNKGTSQTFRNLTASSKILNELQAKATALKTTLNIRQQQLSTFRYQLDSLISVPELFKFPADSLALIKYMQQIQVLAYESTPVDSVLKENILSTQTLLNKANTLMFALQTNQEEILSNEQNMAKSSFRREIENIWEPPGLHRPFKEIFQQAKSKGALTFIFYLENNIGKLIILALLTLSSFIYLRSLKSIYKEHEILANNYEGQLVLRYPFLSATLIVVNIGQFMFFSPPFILNVIFWITSCISLTILFYSFITRYWMTVWLVMVSFFLIAAVDNLILQASWAERWIMLIVSIAGMVTGVYIILKGKKQELREKLIIFSIGFMVILELSSSIANIFGRYNLAKTLLISGYLNVVVSILFLWTLRLINEGLFLAFSVYKDHDKKLFYLNFDKVGKKAPSIFYALFVLGWLILFGRNFAGYEYIVTPVREFFVTERTLGDYTFSINGLLLFFLIMGIALITSKIVSFFASDRHLIHEKDDRSSNQGIGSWLLLIRIFILSTGLFLAIAAAGIPLDRITIVIGALGVGIGFGLQNIVNNLVSGLVIAFEKPVNVGDIVDVDGKEGTMKSVGFRSSVITTWDGADVVMPNGDLLNSHLINWSQSGNRRRVYITLGIAYDSDLSLVKELLSQTLDGEQHLLKKPAPLVQYEQFGSSSIDLRIYFWVRDFRDSASIKSDIIIAIATIFKKNNIKIQIPKQEIYIQNIDDANSSKKALIKPKT
ncbi:MAG: mechanosensitive ion channel domain-containing protein [Bacteroidota bacterium]